ncbi:hypothetical protein [Mucilaginibacter pedocola]|uniref:Apea-like HEPN domain-containing protein n=1 Tax=Mucilaginibacter pedocola TaxID=1792845 RepID=A0A1S9PIS5_9SPHI|nr:hypothetical protein [Mucilaginibacter pedocola]OOQ60870.1 hypothetical protein BC343_23185 [Mucilaginibacter pedocola]
MQISKINTTPAPQIAEIFFVEKCLELLHHSTIESYRLPLHNPKTILKEIIQVTKSLNLEEITNVEHITLLSDEIQALFEKETYLKFNRISTKYFNSILKKKDPNEIFYTVNLVIEENKNYSSDLFDLITAEITRLNSLGTILINELAKLNQLIPFFLIELRDRGYSKRYIYKFINQIFYSKSITNFPSRLNIIKSLINRAPENFDVVIGFKLNPGIGAQLVILDPVLKKLDSISIKAIIKKTNTRIREYFSDNPKLVFYIVPVKALDYYQASYLVRKELQLALDVLFMGYNNDDFNIHQICVVIGSERSHLASLQNLDFQLEGHFRSEQILYDTFSNKISSIKTKNVSTDTINKIEAALRYLRSGSEAKEIENKLLNFWIAIEYFFSSRDAKHSKVKRARDYMKKIHAVTYFKRLLIDFHKNIQLYNLTDLIPAYASNLDYLKDIANFNLIRNNISTPGIAWRAHELQTRIKDKSAINTNLIRHAQKLEWNLLRIYRQRNAIVHAANNNYDMLDITSHLKYYLVFLINSIIDFINETPTDLNMDGKLSLDDFFLLKHIEFDNLILDVTGDVAKLLSQKHPLEYLS